jgi:hypothetical protein
MIRKSGNRFSEKIMLHKKLERQSIQPETIVFQVFQQSQLGEGGGCLRPPLTL